MQKHHLLRLISFSSLLFSSLLFSSLLLLGMLINPTPVQASTIAGEPCLIWWVDKTQDGWTVVATEDLASCPHSCFVGIAGDFHNQSDTWCADLTPPPNLPGVYLGNACSADSSRSVTLLTDGTFGTNFEIEGNGQVVSGTSHTFTGIPEGLFTARAQAHNSNGSSGWSSPVSAQHDYSAPVTTADVVGLAQNGWYVSPVSVSFNANDVGCFGVNQTIYAVNGVQTSYSGSPFTIADDGIHTLQYRSTDGYHLEAEKSGIIPIDSTAPTLQFALDRPQDVVGWWTAPLSITIFADDATSGLASLEYDLNGAGWVSGDSLMLTDGVHTLDAQATDNAGHLSYDGIILPIDSTAPLLNVQITGEQGDNSWFIAPPTLTLSATDATSGLAGVLYQVENSGQTLYTAPLRFTREGLYTVQAFAVDNAQHITTQTLQIGYDITPPQTNAQLTETENGMTITLNRWDGVSGFAFTRVAINGVWSDYHHPITVSETGDYWVQFYTIDFAGNIEAEKIVSFTIAETGVVVTQVPPLVNIIPPANPPNTPPFETREDFPPELHDDNLYFVSPPPTTPPFETREDFPLDLHDEGVYYTYPEDNRVADTSTPPQIVATGDTANGGSAVVPMENRISRIPRPIVDESALPNVNSVPQPNVVFANSPNIIETLQNLDVPDSQTTPASIQTASSPITANNLVNGALATLATLGIITAGAGAITMTATAIAKKKEQDEAKSAQMTTLQAQQSAQSQMAQANWATNQAMQASAKQAVMTQVTQSQANKDFWASYALWKTKVMLAEARRRAQELARKRAEAQARARQVQQSNSAPSQSSSSPLAKLLKTGLFIIALGGVGLAGGSVRVIESPMSVATQMVNDMLDTPEKSCNEGFMTVTFCPFGTTGGFNPAYGGASEGVASATSSDLSKVPFFENITQFISNVVLSMTLTELIAETVSLFVQPVDLVYNLAQIANDAINGTLGWHNVFNAIPFAGVLWRNFDVFRHADDVGGGGLVDNLGDDVADNVFQNVYEVTAIRGSGTNLIQTYNVNGTDFQFNTGHGFHRTHSGGDIRTLGLTSQEVESLIIDDIIINLNNGATIVTGGTSNVSRFSLNINDTQIYYNVIKKSDGTIAIGDYYPVTNIHN